SDGKALGDPFPEGTTTITWRAVDSAGNVGTCSQHVQVTAPRSWQLVCPGTFTVWVGPNDTSGPLILPTAITGEHCDVQIVCSPAKGTPLAVGSTTNVVCTATDPNGETRQCTTTVTVARDTTPPQLQCPTHIVRPAFFSDGSA